MDIKTLFILYFDRNLAPIRDWLNKQIASLDASAEPKINFMILCAALMLNEKKVFNQEINTEYLQSRENEFMNGSLDVWRFVAVSGNYTLLLNAITEKRFDPDTFKDAAGATIWHYLARSHNYRALIESIEEKRFDPNTLKDNSGKTVWHWMVSQGGFCMVPFMFAINEKRFNPDTVKDNNGFTVSDYLCRLYKDEWHKIYRITPADFTVSLEEAKYKMLFFTFFNFKLNEAHSNNNVFYEEYNKKCINMVLKCAIDNEGLESNLFLDQVVAAVKFSIPTKNIIIDILSDKPDLFSKLIERYIVMYPSSVNQVEELLILLRAIEKQNSIDLKDHEYNFIYKKHYPWLFEHALKVSENFDYKWEAEIEEFEKTNKSASEENIKRLRPMPG